MGKRNVTKNPCVFIASILLVIILYMCSGCIIKVEAPMCEPLEPTATAPTLMFEETRPSIPTETPIEDLSEDVTESVPSVKPPLIIQQVTVVEPPKTKYYDVPLSKELQDHIFKLCETHDIDPALVIAMIKRESNYRAHAVGDRGNSLGLMQIQPRWHQERMDELNCPDLLDPYQNVTVGIDILSDLFARGKPVEWVLMAYNGGSGYATRLWKAGEVSDYVVKIFKYMDTLEFKED